MKRLWLAALIVIVISAAVLHAQDTPYPYETIPVESRGVGVALSPDDHTLAVYNHFLIDGQEATTEKIPIRLIDLDTGEEIGTLSGHTDWVTGLDFNSDGSQLVSFHRNGDVNLWDVGSLSLIKTISLYHYGGGWIQFLPDDHMILYRAGEFVLGMLDTESGAITRLFGLHLATFDDFSENYVQYPGRGDITFAAAAVSPDGAWLAVSTANDSVYLWEIESNVRWLLREPSERFGQFSIRKVVFSSDSRQLIYFDLGDEQFHIWDVLEKTELERYDFGSSEFTLAPDNATMAWADRETQAIYMVYLAASDEPTVVLGLPLEVSVAPGVTTVAFTSDGSQLAVGGLLGEDDQSSIYVIDLAQ